jgi:hypothetical protein
VGGRARWRVVACVLVAAAGCTAAEPTASPGDDVSVAGADTPVAATPAAAPSSGAFDPSLNSLDTPLAITVASNGPAGSLAGLNEAANVVEYPLTGGRTALVVVSRSGRAAVGPLRRATAGDASVAAAFEADMVTLTASGATVEELRARGRRVVEESAPDDAVLRDPARRAPFNAYARPGVARQRSASRAGGSAALWRRGSVAPAGGRPAADVSVDVTSQQRVVWTWDPATPRWLRTAGELPAQLADGAPVSAETVVVLEVSGPRDGLAALSGVGPAAVLRGGRRFAARWSRDSRSAAASLQSRDGAVVAVVGRVWTIVCASPCAQQIAPSAPRPGRDAR